MYMCMCIYMKPTTFQALNVVLRDAYLAHFAFIVFIL